MNYKNIIYSAKSPDRKAAIREEFLPSHNPLLKPTKDIPASYRSSPIVKEDFQYPLPASERRLLLLEKQAEQFQYQKQANIVYTRQFRTLAKLLGNQTMEFDELLRTIQNLILRDIPSQPDAALLSRIGSLERQLDKKNQDYQRHSKSTQNLPTNTEYMRAMDNELRRKSKLIHEMSGSISQQIFKETYKDLQEEIAVKNETIKSIQEQAQDSMFKSATHISSLEEELVKRNQTIQKLTFQLDSLKRKTQANVEEGERMRKKQMSKVEPERVTYQGADYNIANLLSQLQRRDSEITQNISVHQQLALELQSIQQQNQHLTNSLADSKSAIQELNNHANHQNYVVAQLQNEAVRAKQEIAQLRHEKALMQRRLEQHLSQTAALRSLNQTQHEQIRKLTVSIQQMRAAITQYELSQDQLMRDRQKYASSAGQLQLSLSQSKIVITNREEQLASIKEQLNLSPQKGKSMSSIPQSNYQSQIFAYERQIASLTAQCEQSSRRQSKYHKDLELYEQELNKIASHKSQFDGILNQLHQKIGFRDGYNNTDEMDPYYSEAQINRLLAEKNELEKQLHEKDELITGLQQDLHKVKADCAKYEQLEQQLAERDNLARQTQEERDSDRLNYQRQFTDMRQVINQLQKRVEQEQQRYQQYIEQRRSMEQQLHNIREGLLELEENQKRLQRENIELRSINDRLNSNIQQLEVTAQQARIESAQADRTNAQIIPSAHSEANHSHQQVRISLQQNYDKQRREWIEGMTHKEEEVSRMLRDKQQLLRLLDNLRTQKQEIAFQLYRQQSSLDNQALNSHKSLSAEDKMIRLSYSNAEDTPKLLASYLQENSRMQRQLQTEKHKSEELSQQIITRSNQIKILKQKVSDQNVAATNFQKEKIEVQIYIQGIENDIKTIGEKLAESELTIQNLRQRNQEMNDHEQQLQRALIKIQEYQQEFAERNRQSSHITDKQDINLIQDQLNQIIQKWHHSQQQRLLTQQRLQQTNQELIQCKQNYQQLRKEYQVQLQTIGKHQSDIQKYRVQNEQLNAAVYTFAKHPKDIQAEEDLHKVVRSKSNSSEEAAKYGNKIQSQHQQNVSSLTRNILKDPSKISCQESRYPIGVSNNSSNLEFGKTNIKKQATQQQQIKAQEQQKMHKKEKSASAHENNRQNYDTDRIRAHSQNVRTATQINQIEDHQNINPPKFGVEDCPQKEVINSLPANSHDKEVQKLIPSLTDSVAEEDKSRKAGNKHEQISAHQAQYLPQQSHPKRIKDDIKDQIKQPSVSQYSQYPKNIFYKPVHDAATTPIYISRPSNIQIQNPTQRRVSSSQSQSHSNSKVRISYGLPNKPHQIQVNDNSNKQRLNSEISNSVSSQQSIRNQNSIHHLSSIPPAQSETKTQKSQTVETHPFPKRQTIINSLASQYVHSKHVIQDRKPVPYLNNLRKVQNNNNQFLVLHNLRQPGTETIRVPNRPDGLWTRRVNPPSSYFSPQVANSYSPQNKNIIFNPIGSPVNSKDRIRVIPITRAPTQAMSPVEVKPESMEGTKKVQMRSVASGRRNLLATDTPSFGVTPDKNEQLQNPSLSQSQDSGIEVLQYDWNAPCCRNR